MQCVTMKFMNLFVALTVHIIIITPTTISNWVGTITLSSSSSQSAEQSAESSHMSYLGLCFSPSTCQDTRSRRRDQNKPSDWTTACHQLMVARRTVLLKGQTQYFFFSTSQQQYSMSSTCYAGTK